MEQEHVWLDYFNEGFTRVYDRPPEDEEREAFISQWGVLGLDTFVSMLSHAEFPDREVAILTLWLSEKPEVSPIFVSLLESPRVRDQWLAALFLGEHQDERAYPYLTRMLTEFFPSANAPGFIEGQLWFESNRIWVARTLAQGNVPDLIPLFREAFIKSVQAERYLELYPAISNLIRGLWYRFQDQLMRWLGEREALGVLTGIDLPAGHLRNAVMQLAFGYCGAENIYRDATLLVWYRVPTPLKGKILTALRQRFGLAQEEQQLYLEAYQTKLRVGEAKERRMKLAEFITELRETLGLTPKQAMDSLHVKNLNGMDFREALEKLQQLVREKEQRSE